MMYPTDDMISVLVVISSINSELLQIIQYQLNFYENIVSSCYTAQFEAFFIRNLDDLFQDDLICSYWKPALDAKYYKLDVSNVLHLYNHLPKLQQENLYNV